MAIAPRPINESEHVRDPERFTTNVWRILLQFINCSANVFPVSLDSDSERVIPSQVNCYMFTDHTVVLTLQDGLKLLTTSQVERLLLLWQRMNAINEVSALHSVA